MSVRAKFRCYSKIRTSEDGETVSFGAVYEKGGGVNAEWAAATPSGTLQMFIANPDASVQFETGADYYLDFTRVEGEEAA
jgi:hypothetical protein